MNKNKIILGIDTSCDDTSVGIIEIIENEIKILADIREDQKELSLKFGGVIPEICARNHIEKIDILFKKALKTANIKLSDIDIFASTVGPGLLSSLIIGYYFTLTLSILNKKIFIPIHHIEGHLSVCNLSYPFLCLMISGGHTMIIKCISFGNYEIIATTLDDAVGELFDKIGRELKLPFPSGSYIENIAKNCLNFEDINKYIIFPTRGKLNFSFSGLKTKFFNLIPELSQENLCYLLQHNVALILKEKIELAVKLTDISNIVICGGVAANLHIRQKIMELPYVFSFPAINLCADNGIMIAFAGLNHYKNNTKFINNYNIDVFARKDLPLFYNL